MENSSSTSQISNEALCMCGQTATTRTWWMENNPYRRFWACRLRPVACDHFSWVDPPLNPSYKKTNRLHHSDHGCLRTLNRDQATVVLTDLKTNRLHHYDHGCLRTLNWDQATVVLTDLKTNRLHHYDHGCLRTLNRDQATVVLTTG
ncbi:Uncharacterized protein Adt_02792 [Abeliophyllum distichum]|uniref:GRF-type domain-containing protein n=1 Tax=Abeliophyllum distichum TaxID=126358 RepID=A0ABD1VWN4_9LAMI